MNSTSCMVDKVLVSIVNDSAILNEIAQDIETRFHINVDRCKLKAYLNSVEVEAKQNVTMA